jgi:hypothetical protein
MSETSINSISSVLPIQMPAQMDVPSTPKLDAPGQAQAKSAAQVQAEALAEAEALAAPKPGAPAEPKPARVDEKSTLPVSNGSNVTIHFRVDDETKELTVFVVDQRSKRVLRSIPAGELNKLQAGDLLKLTA